MLALKWTLILIALTGLAVMLYPAMPPELDVQLEFSFDHQEMSGGEPYDIEIAVFNGLTQPISILSIDAM